MHVRGAEFRSKDASLSCLLGICGACGACLCGQIWLMDPSEADALSRTRAEHMKSHTFAFEWQHGIFERL